MAVIRATTEKWLKSLYCRMKLLLGFAKKAVKPKASEVLTCYLLQMNEPPWTSYFVKVCCYCVVIFDNMKIFSIKV